MSLSKIGTRDVFSIRSVVVYVLVTTICGAASSSLRVAKMALLLAGEMSCASLMAKTSDGYACLVFGTFVVMVNVRTDFRRPTCNVTSLVIVVFSYTTLAGSTGWLISEP